MSIIENAINALARRKDAGKGKVDESGAAPDEVRASQVNTVQRAEVGHGADVQSVSTAPTQSAAPDAQAVMSPGRVAETSKDMPEGTHEQSPETEPLRAKFDSTDEMEDGSTDDRMVRIPFKELRDLGILTPAIPRSAIAEEYRTIKRPLLINITGDSATPPIPHGNLIMVTSALEGDGKTFSAICLAMSVAMEREKNVLFVDADTSKAEAGRTLGVPSTSPGLIDILENGDARLADYILPTNVEKLRILPAGGLHTHANELLASRRMRELMLELSEEDPNRVIIFDSPPLLQTTEAAVLASFMGQIVFVVSSESTPQYAVTEAIEHIGEEKMVGMVLNRARRRLNPYSYQSYDYRGGIYGYGHRGGDSATESGR